MEEKIRNTGINILGDVAWGTHFCQFYKTREDLIDILVPYFKAGLENNEFCMWVTSEPLKVEEAEASLKKAVKNFNNYIKKGQIEILDFSRWYTISGEFEAEKVLEGWAKKEREALKRGFDGLRLTGNTFWLEKKDWKNFADYEETINNIIKKYRMIAICSYSLDKCGASEVIDVVSNHQFALIKREGKWELIESSEHKRAEELMRKSEQRYEQLFDGINDAVIVFGFQGVFLDCNKVALKQLGYSREEFLRLRASDIVHPEFHQVMKDNQKRIWDGETTVIESAHLCKDGRIIPVEVNTNRIEYNGESVILAVVRDITERKQAEQALREKEAFNFALFQYNPIQTLVVDKEGKVVKSNMAKRKSGDRLPNIGDVMYVDYARNHEIDMHAKLIECIRSGKKKSFPELKYEDKFLNVTIAPFPMGAIITSQDITERKQAEEVLKEHQQMLEASEKELRNFSRKVLSIREEEKKKLSTILHDEVGSMVVNLSFALATIEEEIRNNDLRDALEDIKKSKSELKKSVSILKKIAVDLRPPDLEVIGLPGALRELFSNVTKQTDIKINFRVNIRKKKTSDDVKIVLYRIAQEALNNVIKHANATEVKVSLYSQGDMLKFDLLDNGKGFDTEKSLKGPKVKIGLRGMKEMTESLGGTLNIKSASAKGTEIHVTLFNMRKHES